MAWKKAWQPLVFAYWILRTPRDVIWPYTQSPRFIDQKCEWSNQSGWEWFFRAIVDVLNESETMLESPDPDWREAVQIRLEYAIEGIQSILPFLSETRMVMEDILRNLHQIYRQWMGSQHLGCTELALYSLLGPTVEKNGDRGRPRLEIPEDVLINLRSLGLPWTGIARMLLVSRWTLRHCVVELWPVGCYRVFTLIHLFINFHLTNS